MKKSFCLYLFASVLTFGLAVTLSSCGDDDDDAPAPYVPAPQAESSDGKMYVTEGVTYALSMVNDDSGNAYFVTADDNDNLSRVNALLNNGGSASVPATVIFGDNQEVRSITVDDVTYVFRKNPETHKIDVSVIRGNDSQLFPGVLDYTDDSAEPINDGEPEVAARRALTRAAVSATLMANLQVAFGNMNVMLEAVARVNVLISEETGSVFYSAVAEYRAVITSVTGDVSRVMSGTVQIEEVSAEEFQSVVAEIAESVPSLSTIANNTLEQMEQTVEASVVDTDEAAQENTESGEGTIISGGADSKFKVTLTWRYGADIDLHAFEAGFTQSRTYGNNATGHIYYSQKQATLTDGYLDFDNTHGYYIDPTGNEPSDYSRAAIENIYWQTVNDGDYYIYLDYYASHSSSWCDGVTTGPCTISVFVNGVGKSITVDMTSAYHHPSMRYIGKVTFPEGTIDFNSPEDPQARRLVRRIMENPAAK